MAARKKRSKKQKVKVAAKPTVALDAGWESFIGKALDNRSSEALWPDPGAARPVKKARKSVRKRAPRKSK